ncbi:MAG: serine/threonine-protein kinase [Polyangiaceae bacterium]
MSEAEARNIGKYRLYGRIGSGSMGTVHLARFFAPGGFRRIVAIKRLHPQFAEDDVFVGTFLEQARLAARIHHPNVVAPLDVVAENGEVSLVFEHVIGVSLATLMKCASDQNQSVPTRILGSIIVDVLHGLQAAHEAKGDDGTALNLVHRDVSPKNILVGRDGSARILDFGIAKATGRTQVTGEGVVKGKRGYLAPEQLANATSQASDIYSVAVVLWEIIAERRLFADDSTITQRSGEAVQPPSMFVHVSDTDDDRRAYAGLDAIALRGLAHEPTARFASAREMAIAIEDVGVASSRKVGEWVERIAHEAMRERKHLVELAESSNSMLPVPFPSTAPPSVAPITRTGRTARTDVVDVVTPSEPPPKSRRGALGVVAFLVLVVGAGVGFVFWQRSKNSPAPANVVATASAVASDKPRR